MLNRVARLRLGVKECSTRKSDVWAVGVTFFEILIGTPFEKSAGEQRKIWRSTGNVSMASGLVNGIFFRECKGYCKE